ncbi:hypothetical protein ACN6K4_007666 [Streptomyces hayashii]|uniref:hypothetical protein n=1 Tax=Streptomyces hayashii TaxID=2839966 RepID=UPI00403CD654
MDSTLYTHPGTAQDPTRATAPGAAPGHTATSAPSLREAARAEVRASVPDGAFGPRERLTENRLPTTPTGSAPPLTSPKG